MKNTLIATLIIGLAFTSGSKSYSQTLVAFRKGCIYGALAKYNVEIDHKLVGTLNGNALKSFPLTPGNHIISPRQSHRGIKIAARSGETYVVQYKTRFGIFGARAKLKLMTVAQAKKHSKYFREHYEMKM